MTRELNLSIINLCKSVWNVNTLIIYYITDEYCLLYSGLLYGSELCVAIRRKGCTIQDAEMKFLRSIVQKMKNNRVRIAAV